LATRWSTTRKHDDEEPASPEVSRLLVIGFLIAGLLGLLTGLVWVGWNLLRNQIGG
jgi:hypothetical protein